MESEQVFNHAIEEFTVQAQTQYKKGKEKYGVVLTTFNGRDAGQDCLEELVDAVQYLTQLRMENEALKKQLDNLGCENTLLEDTVSDLNREVDLEVTNRCSCEGAIEDLESDIDSLQDDLRCEERRNSHLNDQIDDLNIRIGEMQQELDSIKTVNNELQSELESRGGSLDV